MNKKLALLRLTAQRLSQAKEGASPASVVSEFGAMQGQDLGVLSSVALRLPDNRIDRVIEALRSHKIVRGYPIRSTVFLTSATDMRWITELCSAGTVHRGRQRAEQNFGLTSTDFERVSGAVVAHPKTGVHSQGLSRAEFKELLAEHLPQHAEVSPGHHYRVLFQLQLENIIVQSGWDGKAQRLYQAAPIIGGGIDDTFNADRQAAITELLARYLRSRGPATLRDFAWWSKLPLGAIRRAAEELPDDVEALSAAVATSYGCAGSEQVFVRRGLLDEHARLAKLAAKPRLLPGFDEYILGYQDRLFAMTPAVHEKLVPGNRGIFLKPLIVDGTVRGSWTTGVRRAQRTFEPKAYVTVPKAAEPGLRTAFLHYPFADQG